MPSIVDYLTDQDALNALAMKWKLNPLDLANVISYETIGTFDPNIQGGRNNKYVGIFQAGPSEQKAYDVHKGQSFQEQLGGFDRFLDDRGFKPGMGLLDLYSTVNAGRPGLYDRSDRPGATVASHVRDMMGQHRQIAQQWLHAGQPELGATAQANPSQVGATPQTPPQMTAQQAPDPAAQAQQTAQLAQAQAAQAPQAAPAQQAAQKPVDPVRSFFDRLLTPKARPAGQSPGMLSQMAENAGAPSGTVGLLGKLLMGAGTALGGDSAPPLQAEDTAANVPREDTAQAMQRGQMAQAMLQPNASQQGPSQPPDLADLAQMTPDQIEELRRKGLLGQFGLA